MVGWGAGRDVREGKGGRGKANNGEKERKETRGKGVFG